MSRIFKMVGLSVAGGFLFNSCISDNLWANIWSTTLIDGSAALIRDAVWNLVPVVTDVI